MNQISGSVKCPCCTEFLREPYSLACGHWLCGPAYCIGQLTENETVKCPICALISPANAAVRMFSLDELITTVKSSVDRTRTERRCSTHLMTLSMWCKSCECAICHECIDEHSNHTIKSAKSEKTLKAKQLLKKTDLRGTKELIEEKTKERMAMLEKVELLQSHLNKEIADLDRKRKAIEQMESNYRKISRNDYNDVSSSLISEFNLLDRKTNSANQLKLAVSKIKECVPKVQFEQMKSKSMEGAIFMSFSSADLKWKFDEAKNSDKVLINDYTFHIELTRVKQKSGLSFLKFFVFCEGIYDYEWSVKARLELQIEAPQLNRGGRSKTTRRRVEEDDNLSEEFTYRFKCTANDTEKADGIGFSDFVSWTRLAVYVKQSHSESVRVSCKVKIL